MVNGPANLDGSGMRKLFSGVCAAFCVVASTAAAAPSVNESKDTPPPSGRGICKQLGRNFSGEKGADALHVQLKAALSAFETAIEKGDKKLFRGLVHPAMIRPGHEISTVLEETTKGYGIEGKRPVLNSLHEISLKAAQSSPEAECAPGLIRGVTGPARQWAVFHTVFSGEQVRLFTLFAPILKEQKKEDRPAAYADVGLVLLQAQVYTHAGMSPEKLLEEGKKWRRLDQNLSAWLFAESGTRILEANPYLDPHELVDSREEALELYGKIAEIDAVKRQLATDVPNWSFAGFTPIFQAKGIEPGLRFKAKGALSVKEAMDGCKKAAASVKGALAGLQSVFHGVECLPYSADEETTKPPAAGSVFLPWKDIKR